MPFGIAKQLFCSDFGDEFDFLNLYALTHWRAGVLSFPGPGKGSPDK
jgi:hypothetical protein